MEDGVRLDAVVDTDDPTTLALAELDEDGAATYRFYFEGTSVPGLTPETALSVLPERVEMVHVGTLGLVFEPVADALEAVVAHAERTRSRWSTSTSGRPSSATRPPTGPACDGWSRAAMSSRPPTTTSRGWSRTATRSTRRAALLERGPAVVLLTRGGDGVTVVTRDGETEVPALAVEVVDTIGAGDAFGGGFLAWWRREGLGAGDLARTDAVLEATRYACLVAGRTVERAGASPPRLSELATA